MSRTSVSARRQREGIRAVNVSLVANVILAGLKTAVGIFGHSPALLADGINSTSDAAHSIVVMVFLRLAGRPPDEEHPYGHRQMESIAALVVGAFVVTTSVAIFWDAVNKVYDSLVGEAELGVAALVALWIAFFTVVVKLGLTAYALRIGRRTQNAGVLALASDHRNDVLSASVAAAGILFARMGYPLVDPLVATLVALVVLETGIRILSQASTDLMDTLPGRALGQQITDLVSRVPGVLQVEEIRAHRFGPYLVASVTIGVDGSLSVAEVERILRGRVEFMRTVQVHYHPWTGTHRSATT